MHIKSQKDFYAGAIFVVLGALFGWGALSYRMGTSAHMGPGYFPLLCSVLLAAIGAVLCIRALSIAAPDGGRTKPWAFRAVIFVTLANALFGLAISGWPALHIPPLGFIIATLLIIAVATLASPESRRRETLILAVVLSAASWLVFVFALKMQFSALPSL
ncbi:MAG TPA: tripartite tricarboxylate transporter TctB family protein [Castellaniella sp.]|uniref:tripartite tricarboxylate transporter TctB family protein n=1 Tax=Castellaniella sp. TaxID=1955812 RepID=UPI002EE363B0